MDTDVTSLSNEELAERLATTAALAHSKEGEFARTLREASERLRCLNREAELGRAVERIARVEIHIPSHAGPGEMIDLIRKCFRRMDRANERREMAA